MDVRFPRSFKDLSDLLTCLRRVSLDPWKMAQNPGKIGRRFHLDGNQAVLILLGPQGKLDFSLHPGRAHRGWRDENDHGLGGVERLPDLERPVVSREQLADRIENP